MDVVHCAVCVCVCVRIALRFRSLQSQLRIILTYKKSVIVRIQRFANMLIRDKKKHRIDDSSTHRQAVDIERT